MAYRTELINSLINLFGYKNYLEIGVGEGINFKDIEIENKECCDPNSNDEDGYYSDVTYEMTSDKMFETIDKDKKWDIIFIDGYHEGNQVMRDLFNSMKHLSDNGIILIHDSIPCCTESTAIPRIEDIPWFGTVFKIYPVLKELEIDFFIVNADCGIGIVPKQTLPDEIPLASSLEFKDVFADKTAFDKVNIINTDTLNTFFAILVNLYNS